MVPVAKGSQGSSSGVLTVRSKKQRFSDRDSSKHAGKREKKEGKREREGAKKKKYPAEKSLARIVEASQCSFRISRSKVSARVWFVCVYMCHHPRER